VKPVPFETGACTIGDWIKDFSKRSYIFWFVTTINEERLHELRNEHLKYYYMQVRM